MVLYEYIAGFFDGEGYCSIMKRSPGGHSRSPYWIIASMANTHKGVLDEIQKVFGGKVIFHTGGTGRNHPHYRLTFYTQQAINFIRTIRPYLIIKQREADMIIEFADHLLKPKHYGFKLTDEELSIRHEFYLKMKNYHGNKGADLMLLAKEQLSQV